MVAINVASKENKQVIDITEVVKRHTGSEVDMVNVFVAHTTCAVTTADLDPGTDKDLVDAVWNMIPVPEGGFRHPHNPAHAPAHLVSSIIGPNVSIPVEKGRLQLGTWQRIVLVELDGPRDRKIFIS